MLSIDEAIARERQLAERNMILLDFDELVQKSFDTYLRAEYHEQIVMWLEELKVLKENSISKEAFEKMKSKSYQYGYRKGYAKAIDDVLKLPKYTFYDTSKEFMNIRIDAISIEDILKLKEKTNEQRKQSKPNRND